jgi:hypothetical protein
LAVDCSKVVCMRLWLLCTFFCLLPLEVHNCPIFKTYGLICKLSNINCTGCRLPEARSRLHHTLIEDHERVGSHQGTRDFG